MSYAKKVQDVEYISKMTSPFPNLKFTSSVEHIVNTKFGKLIKLNGPLGRDVNGIVLCYRTNGNLKPFSLCLNGQLYVENLKKI